MLTNGPQPHSLSCAHAYNGYLPITQYINCMKKRKTMADTKAVQAEKRLAQLLTARDESSVLAWLEEGRAADIEFTGRCLSLAITQGMADAAVALGQLGFHLAVTDDAAAQRAIEQASSMRGLLCFLEGYRYCKAQRSYYLAVVESDDSVRPVERMLAEGLLSTADRVELLSLALRSDKPALARVLADGGAKLSDSAQDEVPVELRSSAHDSATSEGELWARLATPQRSCDTLSLIFEHVNGYPCSVHRSWWGSYARQEGFAAKLAAIACHSDASHCDCTQKLLVALASTGHAALEGLSAVLGWSGLESTWLDEALLAAQEADNAQGAALIMRAAQEAGGSAGELDLLEF